MITSKFKILIGFVCMAFFSCTNPVSDKSENNSETPAFLKEYKQTALPIKMKGCFGNSHWLPLIHPDSLIANNEDGTVPYCTFKTNGDYYAVIRLGLTDCAIPNIITYDKTGHIIDEKWFGIGYCGSGPGFHCEEFAIINKDFSIYTSDTIAEAEIDSLGHEIKETLKKCVIYKKGKLLSSGKIELTDTIRQIIY